MAIYEGDSNNPAVVRWRLDDLTKKLDDFLDWRRGIIEKITRNTTKIEELEDVSATMLRKIDSLQRTVLGLSLSIATSSLAICLTLVLR
jgi:hypothetical protein